MEARFWRSSGAFLILLLSQLSSASSAQEMMRHREDGMQGGGGVGHGIGLGIGIGTGLLIDQLRRKNSEQPSRSETRGREASRLKSKGPPTKKAEKPRPVKETEAGRPKSKGPPTSKAETPAPEKETEPKDSPEKVSYSPLPFPVFEKLGDCDACTALFNSIVEYEKAMSADMEALARDEKTIADLEAERDRLSKAPVKVAADKASNERLIEIDNASIKVRKGIVEDMRKRVAEEQKILSDRIEQYKQCYERYCPAYQTNVFQPLLPTEAVNSPTEPPPDPKPREEKIVTAEEQPKICGPDITDNVLNVLRDIRHDFLNNPDKQKEACRSLLDPHTAGGAWDIRQLDPSTSPNANQVYHPGTDNWTGDGVYPPTEHPWFTRYSKNCAQPRAICGATVEFMGTCQHPQIVNYTQWGFMLSLCESIYPVAGAAAHKVWNRVKYGPSAPTDQQQSMIQVGDELADAFNADPLNDQGKYGHRVEELKKRLLDREKSMKHQEQACELKCVLDPETKDQLARTAFGYHWTGLTPDPIGGALSDKAVRDTGKAVIDHELGKARNTAQEIGDSINR